MGLFKKRADPDEIEQLKAEIATMSARLHASESASGHLDSRVQGLVDRLDAPTPAPLEPPPAAPPATIDPAELDKLNAKLERLSTRVDAEQPTGAGVDPADVAELDATMRRISERVDEIDQRITSISTELANQITELSSDIESMGGNEPATDEVVDELRDAQERLATEQARYQIAFRQDLADLADRLRRA